MVDPRFWDGIAVSYAAKPLDDPAAWQRKLAEHRALLTPDDVWLDVGCATGSLSLELAPHLRQIHGLDLSPAMVGIAEARAVGVANVSFSVGTLDGLDRFGPGELDGISAYSLLHLVDDLDETLARMHALLEPGGFLVASTVCLGDGWIPYRPILWAMRAVGKAPYVRILRRTALLEAFHRAGFVDVQTPDVGAVDANILFSIARRAE